MSESAEIPDPSRLPILTSQIVSAYIAHNKVAASELSALIEQVHDALANIGSEVTAPTAQQPAVPVKKSVFPDYIVCLEDGKKMKMLKRHLATSYNMTPQQYRDKWGLPRDYPMVAPGYSTRRSELAKSIGLGQKQAEPSVSKLPARRAEGSKR